MNCTKFVQDVLRLPVKSIFILKKPALRFNRIFAKLQKSYTKHDHLLRDSLMEPNNIWPYINPIEQNMSGKSIILNDIQQFYRKHAEDL